jgi:hypothetical protein
MSADMSAKSVSARIAEVGRLSNLDTAHRLESKIDMSPAGVSRRIRQVEMLRALCKSLRAGRRTDYSKP